MNILGVKIDNLEKKEILEKVEGFLHDEKFHQIATVNPEFILAAQKDKEFKKILNTCDLNVADGVGLKFAFWKLSFQKLKCRIAGVDLMNEILKMASDRGLRIFLVANKDGLSSWEETRGAIKNIYPNIRVGGINMILNDSKENQKSKIKNQNFYNFDILFCNLGHPYQEKFIYSLKQGNYGKIRLAMGVGGSFDFVAGKVRRAPLWMRKIGLEWLFRLILKPSRFRRIFRAVVIFPIKIIC